MRVTDRDREKAWEMVRLSYQPCPDEALRDAIASALAAERDKARAPFLALAKEYALTELPPDYGSVIAAEIRRAAEDPS